MDTRGNIGYRTKDIKAFNNDGDRKVPEKIGLHVKWLWQSIHLEAVVPFVRKCQSFRKQIPNDMR